MGQCQGSCEQLVMSGARSLCSHCSCQLRGDSSLLAWPGQNKRDTRLQRGESLELVPGRQVVMSTLWLGLAKILNLRISCKIWIMNNLTNLTTEPNITIKQNSNCWWDDGCRAGNSSFQFSEERSGMEKSLGRAVVRQPRTARAAGDSFRVRSVSWLRHTEAREIRQLCIRREKQGAILLKF